MAFTPSHTTFSWANGDVPVAGTHGTKGQNNLEQQYNDMYNDLPAWLTATGLVINSKTIVNPAGYVCAPLNVGASVYPTANPINVPYGTTYIVPFDGEHFDPNGNYNNSGTGTPYSFNAPVAGKYRVSGQVTCNAVAATSFTVQILVNGTAVRLCGSATNPNYPICLPFTAILPLAAGDKVQIACTCVNNVSLSTGFGLTTWADFELVQAN
jgi:hypothetical protein